MNEFKLIVAGGRDFNDYELLQNTLLELNLSTYADHALSIVSGMAQGADSLAVLFAKRHNVQLYKFPADWDKHGKSAGPIRNHAMAAFADGLLAFWDNKSRGTAHMITSMQTLRKPVHIVNY